MRLLLTILLCALARLQAEEKFPDINHPETLKKICSEALQAKDVKKNRNDNLLYTPDDLTKPYTGWCTFSFPNGKLDVLFHVSNGVYDGPFVQWHEDGTRKGVGHYKEGLRDGVFTVWDEKGIKLSECIWKQGILDGLSLEWHRNGKKSLRNSTQRGNPMATTPIGTKTVAKARKALARMASLRD